MKIGNIKPLASSPSLPSASDPILPSKPRKLPGSFQDLHAMNQDLFLAHSNVSGSKDSRQKSGTSRTPSLKQTALKHVQPPAVSPVKKSPSAGKTFSNYLEIKKRRKSLSESCSTSIVGLRTIDIPSPSKVETLPVPDIKTEPKEQIELEKPIEPKEQIEPKESIVQKKKIKQEELNKPEKCVDPEMHIEPEEQIEPIEPEKRIDPEKPIEPEVSIESDEQIEPEEPIKAKEQIETEEPIKPKEQIEPEEPIEPEKQIELENQLESEEQIETVKHNDASEMMEEIESPENVVIKSEPLDASTDDAQPENAEYFLKGVEAMKEANLSIQMEDGASTKIKLSERDLAAYLAFRKSKEWNMQACEITENANKSDNAKENSEVVQGDLDWGASPTMKDADDSRIAKEAQKPGEWPKMSSIELVPVVGSSNSSYDDEDGFNIKSEEPSDGECYEKPASPVMVSSPKHNPGLENNLNFGLNLYAENDEEDREIEGYDAEELRELGILVPTSTNPPPTLATLPQPTLIRDKKKKNNSPKKKNVPKGKKQPNKTCKKSKPKEKQQSGKMCTFNGNDSPEMNEGDCAVPVVDVVLVQYKVRPCMVDLKRLILNENACRLSNRPSSPSSTGREGMSSEQSVPSTTRRQRRSIGKEELNAVLSSASTFVHKEETSVTAPRYAEEKEPCVAGPSNYGKESSPQPSTSGLQRKSIGKEELRAALSVAERVASTSGTQPSSLSLPIKKKRIKEKFIVSKKNALSSCGSSKLFSGACNPVDTSPYGINPDTPLLPQLRNRTRQQIVLLKEGELVNAFTSVGMYPDFEGLAESLIVLEQKVPADIPQAKINSVEQLIVELKITEFLSLHSVYTTISQIAGRNPKANLRDWKKHLANRISCLETSKETEPDFDIDFVVILLVFYTIPFLLFD